MDSLPPIEEYFKERKETKQEMNKLEKNKKMTYPQII